MNKKDQLAVPILRLESRENLPVPKRLARLTLCVLAAAVSVAWLLEPQNDVQLTGNVYFNIRWMDVFLHTLFATTLLFAVSCFLCELTGYAKRKFLTFSGAACALLTVTAAWWRYYFSIPGRVPDTPLTYLPNKLCLWGIALAAVFLLGKFVLFKNPPKEPEK